MNEIITPMDTSELAVRDNIDQQKARTAFNRFKQTLLKNDKCWKCFNLSHCTGYYVGGKRGICDVVKNSDHLMTLYSDYKEKEKKAKRLSQ